MIFFKGLLKDFFEGLGSLDQKKKSHAIVF